MPPYHRAGPRGDTRRGVNTRLVLVIYSPGRFRILFKGENLRVHYPRGQTSKNRILREPYLVVPDTDVRRNESMSTGFSCAARGKSSGGKNVREERDSRDARRPAP